MAEPRRGEDAAADGEGPRPAESHTPAVARIVEVGTKEVTEREAVAECSIAMTPEACGAVVAGTPKGNPIEAARIAGIMARPLALATVEMRFEEEGPVTAAV